MQSRDQGDRRNYPSVTNFNKLWIYHVQIYGLWIIVWEYVAEADFETWFFETVLLSSKYKSISPGMEMKNPITLAVNLGDNVFNPTREIPGKLGDWWMWGRTTYERWQVQKSSRVGQLLIPIKFLLFSKNPSFLLSTLTLRGTVDWSTISINAVCQHKIWCCRNHFNSINFSASTPKDLTKQKMWIVILYWRIIMIGFFFPIIRNATVFTRGHNLQYLQKHLHGGNHFRSSFWSSN